MLYQIGTTKELQTLESKLPKETYIHLTNYITTLDKEYGSERNYLESGGYALMVEAKEDISSISKYIDLQNHPCEYVKLIDGYLSALYLTNNEYSILLLIPAPIAPDYLLAELDEDN